jgi:hypothetical protein
LIIVHRWEKCHNHNVGKSAAITTALILANALPPEKKVFSKNESSEARLGGGAFKVLW